MVTQSASTPRATTAGQPAGDVVLSARRLTKRFVGHTALEDVDYDGVLAIETFPPDTASIAAAASVWRPLAASPDALARDGLRFLRGVQDG